MALIHGRRRNREWRYRLYDNVVEQYITSDLTRDQLFAELNRTFTSQSVLSGAAAREIEIRLARVHRQGTSSVNYRHARCINGPWEEEREITPEERYGDVE